MHQRHIDDGHIARLLASRDQRGMRLLFDAYYRPLVLWADTFLNDMPAAEDLVQELLVAFWEKERFANIASGKLRGYLFTTVRNTSLNALRRRDPLHHAIGIDEIELLQLTPDDLTEEMLRMVESEIEKLPPRTREVLRAVYIEGLKYSECALRFHISVATVKTLLVNALKRIRAAVAKYFSKS